jgi:hypothetical protein
MSTDALIDTNAIPETITLGLREKVENYWDSHREWRMPRFRMPEAKPEFYQGVDDLDEFGTYLGTEGWQFDFATDKTAVTYRGYTFAIPAASANSMEFVGTVAMVELMARAFDHTQMRHQYEAWMASKAAPALVIIREQHPDAEYAAPFVGDKGLWPSCVATHVVATHVAIFAVNGEPLFQPCAVVARVEPSKGNYVITDRTVKDTAVPIFDVIKRLRETDPAAYAGLLKVVVTMTDEKLAAAKAAAGTAEFGLAS